jgi:hypothetical protein
MATRPIEWLCAETKAGGLLFLIAVLQRLGYQDWLDIQPEWARFDIARRVMLAVLHRVGMTADDPAWSLAACEDTSKPAPRRFVAPERWSEGLYIGNSKLRAAETEHGRTLWDPSGRLLLGAWTGSCPRRLLRARRLATADCLMVASADPAHLVTTAWLIATHRWLRRYSGIGFADLVLRRGVLVVTSTHVDLFFDHALADLRLRRAGLDLDPGWVPWLGRVGTFHYGAIE